MAATTATVTTISAAITTAVIAGMTMAPQSLSESALWLSSRSSRRKTIVTTITAITTVSMGVTAIAAITATIRTGTTAIATTAAIGNGSVRLNTGEAGVLCGYEFL